MKRIVKTLGFLLVLILCLSLLGVSALAAGNGKTINVTSQEELVAALNRTEKVAAINITRDFTVTEPCYLEYDDAHLPYYHDTSLTVQAGVTLTVGKGGEFGNNMHTYDWDKPQEYTPNGAAVNNGTIVVQNGGRVDGGFETNNGEVYVESGGHCIIFRENRGEVQVLAGGAYLTGMDGDVYNYGRVQVDEGATTGSRFGTTFHNEGIFILDGDASYAGYKDYQGVCHYWFENNGIYSGGGRINVTTESIEFTLEEAQQYVDYIKAQLANDPESTVIVTLNGQASYEEGWVQRGDGNYAYRLSDGHFITSAWREIKGAYYYFDDTSARVTGWREIGGKFYYFDKDGIMQTGWVKSSGFWFYLRPSGAMATGWQKVDGVYYYFDEDGTMLTGWQEIDGEYYYLTGAGMWTGWKSSGGSWYYLKPSGAMATGWQRIEGIYYYFGENGAMVKGWNKVDGVYYYFTGSGAMVTGWLNDNGTYYYFDPSGAMATGWRQWKDQWYYFNASGAMRIGWLQSGSTWYYFKSDGAMAAGETVDGYTFDAKGTWVG